MVLLKPLRQGRGVGFGGDRRDVGTRGARALGLSPYVSESTSCKSTSCERLDREGGRCDEALQSKGAGEGGDPRRKRAAAQDRSRREGERICGPGRRQLMAKEQLSGNRPSPVIQIHLAHERRRRYVP